MNDPQPLPTDAELRTWVQSLIADDDSVRTNDERDHMNFARAVLAKWGTPPAVAGEPVAWLSTDSIGERYLCFTKPNDSDPVRPLVFGDTTPQPTQAQAGAVPLTDEQVGEICDQFTKLVREKRARHIERGIDAGADYYIGDVAHYVGHAVNQAAHGIGIKKENGNG